MASQMRLGGRTELRPARSSTAFTSQRPVAAPRVVRSVTVAANKRKDAAPLLPAGAAAAVTLLAAGQAVAETVTPSGTGIPTAGPTVSVDSAVNSVIDAVKAAGGVVQQGLDVAGVGAQYAKEAVDKAAPYVKTAADTVSPYVKTAVDTVKDVAGPALRQAQPTLQSSIGDAQKLLQQQGLDTNAVQSAGREASQQASGAFEIVRPTLNRVVDFVSSTPAPLLAEYALGGLVAYWLAPPVLRLLGGGLRGYAGDVSAPAALDLVATRRNTFIVDLRSEREKESGGVLDVPGGAARLIELEYAAVEDRKLRSQLRNVSQLELQVTSMEVASLKKIGKGSTVLLIDRNGSQAKAVAKQLSARGFRRVFVVSGGFAGWTNAKLRVKPSGRVGRVEVLPPVFGTISRNIGGGSNRKALPSGR